MAEGMRCTIQRNGVAGLIVNIKLGGRNKLLPSGAEFRFKVIGCIVNDLCETGTRIQRAGRIY